jgi:hypothetical protein
VAATCKVQQDTRQQQQQHEATLLTEEHELQLKVLPAA